jgi:hypothetical protein
VVTNSSNGGGSFLINKSTGESTLLGPAGANSFSSISAHPKTGVIYGFRSSGGQTLLNKLDATTGKLYSRITLDLNDVTGSAFDTSGTLYLVSKRNLLYKYNETDNSLIRTDSIKCTVSAIAFDPSNNLLYASIYKPLGADKDKLLRIIQGLGDTLRIGNLGNNKPVRTLFFDETGGLFGFTGVASASGELTAINKTNGLGTVIGSTGLIGLVSAAYYPGVINSINETSDGSLISAYKLFDNYPNPFNPSTVIRFTIPVSGMVSLVVYNTLGEKVAVLINGNMNAGEHKVEFDASGLTSGVYFCELRTGDFRSMKKMVLLR